MAQTKIRKEQIQGISQNYISIGTSYADYIVSGGSLIQSQLESIFDTYPCGTIHIKNDNGNPVYYLFEFILSKINFAQYKIICDPGVRMTRPDNVDFAGFLARTTGKGVSPIYTRLDYLEVTGGTWDFNSDGQTEKDWVGFEISQYNAEDSYGSSASKNYLTGATKGVVNLSHDTIYFHDVEIKNTGFNGFGVGSGRPAGTGQGAIYGRDVQQVIIDNVLTDNTDAPYSFTRCDRVFIRNGKHTNYNFDGQYFALCGYVEVDGVVVQGQGTPSAVYNNYSVNIRNLNHSPVIYTVTGVTSNTVFNVDCPLTDDDRLNNKSLYFPTTNQFAQMGYNITQTSTNTLNKYTISDYVGSTKTITLSTPTANPINIGDKVIVGTEGFKISKESGVTSTPLKHNLENITVRGVPSVDPVSKGGLVITSGVDTVTGNNVSILGAYEYGLYTGDVENVKISNLLTQGSGLSGVLNNATGAVYDNLLSLNNGQRTVTGDRDGFLNTASNVILINPQITDRQSSKTQQKAIRSSSPADNLFVLFGNLAGNLDNEATILSGTNTIFKVGGVNGDRFFTTTHSSGGTLTLNRQNGNPQVVLLTSDVTTYQERPGQVVGDVSVRVFQQDGTGGRKILGYNNVVTPGSTGNAPIVWAGGVAPEWSTNPNARDTIVLRYGTDGRYYEVSRSMGDTGHGFTNLNRRFSQTANGTTIVNTVTPSSIIGTGSGSLTIPANYFLPGRVLEFEYAGVLSTTGTPTITFTAQLAGSDLNTTPTVTMPSGASNIPFRGMVRITCRTSGSSGTVRVENVFRWSVTSTTQQSAEPIVSQHTVDTTQSLAFNVNATWGSASPSNSLTTIIGLLKSI